MSTQFKITRIAMNADRVYLHGLIIKLTYTFPKIQSPHLEVFEDNEKTRTEEWDIYGAKDQDNNDDQVRVIEFTDLQQSIEFELIGIKYRIQFLKFSEQEVNYPRTGKTLVPVYYFAITIV